MIYYIDGAFETDEDNFIFHANLKWLIFERRTIQ